MCGIAGIVTHDPQELDPLKAMAAAIRHRGPDGEGFWISKDGKTGLANRRLAILDTSKAGAQPMHYLDRYAITYNGEIYNYIELKEQLQQKGYSFASGTDTEVLLAMYDWKGKDCLQYLDGMFAFALYDAKEKILFCARDRFGEKPFFYSCQPGKRFLFGSEMKALWAAGVPQTVNEKMLYRYLVYQEEQDAADPSLTFYKEIKKIPSAHYLVFSTADFSVDISRYWNIDPSVQDISITEEKAIEKFTDLFYTSISRRLRSDVETGSSLSGGLDSSVVVRSIIEVDKSSVRRHAFSAQFPGFIKDEKYYQDLVAANTGVFHHVVEVTAQRMLENMKKVFTCQEEPFESNSVNAQYEVYQLAKENKVTVLLDGQGADELLAGYPGEHLVPFLKGIKNKKHFRQQRSRFLQLHKDNKLDTSRRLALKASLPDAVIKTATRWIKPVDRSWLNKDFVHAYGSEKRKEKETRDLNKALYDSSFGGLETLLRYADRNSMAHGVEVRLPFLYHELATFIFSLPPHFKIRDGWTKWIARKSFAGKLPDEIIWRKEKVGFEPPDKNFRSIPGPLIINADKLKNYLSVEAGKSISPRHIWKTLMLQYLLNKTV